MTGNFKKFLLPAALILSWLFVFFEIVTVRYDQRIGLDDSLLIEPLRKVQSFSDYARAIPENKIWDLQPLRDLSYFFDLQIEKWSGFSSFHLTSLLIYFLLLWAFWECLKLLVRNPFIRVVAFFLVAFHPALILTTDWVGARKHLLALMFLAWSHLNFLKFRAESRGPLAFRALILYLASLLSQPIFVLYGFWAAWTLRNSKTFSRSMALSYVALSSGIGLGNFLYYKYWYLLSTYGLGSKIQNLNWTNVGLRVLLLGRFCLDLLIPVYVSPVPYELHQPLSFLGLIVFAFALGAFWKKTAPAKSSRGRRDSILILLPLVPFLIFYTDAGGIDSYLIGSLFFLGLKIAQRLDGFQISPVWRRLVCFYAFVMVLSSWQISQAFLSSSAYWERALMTDPNDYTEIQLAAKLLRDDSDFQRIAEILDRMLLKYKNHDQDAPEILYKVLGDYILQSPRTQPEKDVLFQQYANSHIYYQYFWARHLAKTHQQEKLYEKMEWLWKKDPRQTLFAMTDYDFQLVTAAWNQACLELKKAHCETINERINFEIKNLRRPEPNR